ncbi:MAG: hypothetical protein JKY87_02080, partial [Mariprofundus sp.]|nr:hypothetical protein [Mariprofundus sp.]
MQVNGAPCRAVNWHVKDAAVQWVQQCLLPHQFKQVSSRAPEDVALAIVSMQIRGAPSIGAAAAFGLVLAWQTDEARFFDHWLPRFRAT